VQLLAIKVIRSELVTILLIAKGKVYKGTPFNYLKGSVEDKARVQEITVSHHS